MNSKHTLPLLIILILLVSTFTTAQWVKTRTAQDGPLDKIASIAVNGSKVFLATANHGVLRSTDNGMTWDSVNTGIPGFRFCYAVTHTGTALFAGFLNTIYRSTNDGDSWVEVPNGLTGNWTVYSLTHHGNDVYAGVLGDGVFRSTDNGDTWILKTNGMNSPWVWHVAASDSMLIATTAANGIFRSTNKGTSWDSINTGLPSLSPRGTAIQGKVLFAIVQDRGVFRSTDRGAHWIPANSGLNGPQSLSIASLDTTVFVSEFNRIWRWSDQNSNWIDVSGGTTFSTASALAFSATHMIAGTSLGEVWIRPLSELVTGVRSGMAALPDGFSLEQNYPNPFNPETVIRFSVPQQASTTLTIHDALGREVSELLNEELPAGSHTVRWNGLVRSGESAASGIYFYRMRSGAFAVTKKMLLLR
jgi:photosystem II stability/assembly factor-like uncharacterized protein